MAVVHNAPIHYTVTSLEKNAHKDLDKVSVDKGELKFPHSLHRVAGAGASGRNQDLDAIRADIANGATPPLSTLFMTYSFDLRVHLAAGTVEHNP